MIVAAVTFLVLAGIGSAHPACHTDQVVLHGMRFPGDLTVVRYYRNYTEEEYMAGPNAPPSVLPLGQFCSEFMYRYDLRADRDRPQCFDSDFGHFCEGDRHRQRLFRRVCAGPTTLHVLSEEGQETAIWAIYRNESDYRSAPEYGLDFGQVVERLFQADRPCNLTKTEARTKAGDEIGVFATLMSTVLSMMFLL